MTYKELFQSGQLQRAADAVTQELRNYPNDTGRRSFLFEALCFLGDYDRAQKQLDIINQQDEKADWVVQVYKNLLVAERKRQSLFAEGIPPEFFEDPPKHVQQHLEAVRRWHTRSPQVVDLLSAAEQHRPLLTGRLGDISFEEIRDCDDLLAPVLEIHVMQDYIWIPWDQVVELEISPPERPRDLIWAPIRVQTTGGRQQRGYLPLLYVNSFWASDEQIKLGRTTDWASELEGVTCGVGQKMILAGNEAYSLLEFTSLELTHSDEVDS